MTQVTLEWDGAQWALDTEDITMAQAFVIKDQTKDDQYPAGRNLAAWELGLKTCEPGCVRGLYWLMLQQAGQSVPITSVPGTFAVLKFHHAWADAANGLDADPDALRQAIADGDRQLLRLRDQLGRAEAAAGPAEPEGPTSPPGSARARSAAHGSRTARETAGAAPGPALPS
jgi:hypothetical protein